ncbi:MAG: hypothetical protein ABFC34_15495 [Methanobacterium sp.]
MNKITQEPKMYYCEEKNAFCLTDSCVKGKELLHCPEVSRGIQFYGFGGYVMEGIPGPITTHLTFKDGTKKKIDCKISFCKGCEINE